MLLMDGDEIRELVAERINSRQWWVIPRFTENALELCKMIEERFYSGEKNRDFEIGLVPPESGCAAIAFARKHRMTPKQLAKLAGHPSPGEITGDQDIIMVPRDETPEGIADLIIRVNIFRHWLGDLIVS